mgnify:CR=1 FL=1
MCHTDFSPVHIPEIGEETIERINELNARLEKEGATLLMTAYPIAICDYTPNREEYEAFSDEIGRLLDCPLISRYEDYILFIHCSSLLSLLFIHYSCPDNFLSPQSIMQFLCLPLHYSDAYKYYTLEPGNRQYGQWGCVQQASI